MGCRTRSPSPSVPSGDARYGAQWTQTGLLAVGGCGSVLLGRPVPATTINCEAVGCHHVRGYRSKPECRLLPRDASSGSLLQSLGPIQPCQERLEATTGLVAKCDSDTNPKGSFGNAYDAETLDGVGYGRDQEQAPGTAALPIGRWVHVAVTLGKQSAKMYVDGVEVAESDSITIRPADFRPALNLIGDSQFPADPTFHGSIDDFRIYNTALSAARIATLAGESPAPVSPAQE